MTPGRYLRHLSDNGDDRLVIEFGTVEPVEHVNRTGSLSGETDADLSSVFGACCCEQRGGLFMPNLKEFGHGFGPIQCAEDGIDTVACVPKYALHTLVAQPLYQFIT